MIQVEQITLENFRGVRNLTLPMGRENFVIQGPNATGKSCVVDGIEFGLTGNLSRLAGEDTKDLSLLSHAPHVDSKSNPEAAKVTLRLYVANTKQTFTVTRSVKKPHHPIIKPDTPETRQALALFSKRDEITLTRRQIVRYILTQATKRGDRVQQLLRLSDIGTIRKALGTARSKCKTEHTNAESELSVAKDAVCRHFDIPTYAPSKILDCVNKYRTKLGQNVLHSLEDGPCCETKLPGDVGSIVRATALRDIQAFRESLVPDAYDDAVAQIEQLLNKLEKDPKLNQALRTKELIELGLTLLDDDLCPLCDAPRSQEELKLHFIAKQKLCHSAEQIAKDLTAAIAIVTRSCETALSQARIVWKIAESVDATTFAESIGEWASHLKDRVGLLEQGVSAVEALRGEFKTLLSSKEIEDRLADLEKTVAALPDQASAAEAVKFLADADSRLSEYRRRHLASVNAATIYGHAKFAYDTYCDVATSELESLYGSVEETFANSYRSLHSDDEKAFSAKFRPSEGKLDLDVEFHGRGLHPPGAYHSEGHQDSMGLCLYLALMKQVFGDELRLVVLDDVVMSVDSGHRREICNLLKNEFPSTQFVITTHEEAWFYQMQTTGLVQRKNARMFTNWTPEEGPLVSDIVETWGKIDDHLKRNDVPAASSALRRHLEFIFPQIADGLRASVLFSLNRGPEAGSLLSACHPRLKKLLGDAKKCAKSWEDNESEMAVDRRLQELSDSVDQVQKEGKYVTAAIHFNDWASLVKQDFIPVMNAYKRLLRCFQCEHCESLLRKDGPGSLACDCKKTLFNLKTKTS